MYVKSVVVGGKKSCTSCGHFLPLNKFRSRIQHGREYIIARCRKCEYEHNFNGYDREKRRQRERKANNPVRWKRKYEYKRQWLKDHPNYDKERYHKNLEISRGYGEKYRNNNRQKIRKSSNERHRKRIDTISDLYVKGLLRNHTSVAFGEIPKPLIELKRIQILAKRIIKQQEYGSRRTSQSNV